MGRLSLRSGREAVLNARYRFWNVRDCACSRYRAGVVPMCRLKTRVKWLWSANPLSSAIWLSAADERASASVARRTRISQICARRRTVVSTKRPREVSRVDASYFG